MMKLRAFAAVAIMSVLGSGCALMHRSADTIIDPADAAQSVVLHVENRSTGSVELRTVVQGRSDFIGSVGASDVTNILLDRSLFPTASLYIVGIPTGSGGRANVGPLAASKGATINLVLESSLPQSHATISP